MRPTFGAVLLTSLGWAPAVLAQAQHAALDPATAPPPAADFPAPAAEQPPAAQPPAAPPPAASPAPPAPPAPVAPVTAPPATTEAPLPPPGPAPLPPADADSSATTETASAPRVKRSRFFTAFHLGGGYFHASSGSSSDSRRFSGGTVSGMLALGGRVGRQGNVALAGAFMRDQVYGLRSHDAVIDGDEPHLNDVTFALWAVGFLVDYAPERDAGWHFQGLVGAGALSVSSPTDPDDPMGYMASLGAGYDFRVNKDWTIGGLLRATYAPLDSSEVQGNSTTVYILVPSLLLTASTR